MRPRGSTVSPHSDAPASQHPRILVQLSMLAIRVAMCLLLTPMLPRLLHVLPTGRSFGGRASHLDATQRSLQQLGRNCAACSCMIPPPV